MALPNTFLRTADGRTTDGRTDGRTKKIRTKNFLTENFFGRKKIGGKARVTEIPGGQAPPDPPTTPFQKICPSGANFLK